jgi:hypothetical protein
MSGLGLAIMLAAAVPPIGSARIVVLMENSLRFGLADPEGQSTPAALIPLMLAGKDDSVALVSFSSGAEVRVALSGPSDRALVGMRLALGALAHRSGSACLAAGLSEAAAHLLHTPKAHPTRDRIIVVTAGGELHATESNKEDIERIEKFVVPQLMSQGVVLNTIALTGASGTSQLAEWSTRTGGALFPTDPSALPFVFASLFAQATSSDLLDVHEGQFIVDHLVRRAEIFAVSREGPCRVTTPRRASVDYETRTPDVRFESSGGLDRITLIRPFPGNWRITCGDRPGRAVVVVTDGSTLDIEPYPVRPTLDGPFVLDAHLALPKGTDAHEIVVEATLSGGGVEPRTIDLPPKGRGVWSATVKTATVGHWEIEVMARGPTVRRVRRVSLEVDPSCFWLENERVRTRSECGARELSGRVLAGGREKPLVFGPDLTAQVVPPELMPGEHTEAIAELEAHLEDGRTLHAALGPFHVSGPPKSERPPWAGGLAWRLGAINGPLAAAWALMGLRQRRRRAR